LVKIFDGRSDHSGSTIKRKEWDAKMPKTKKGPTVPIPINWPKIQNRSKNWPKKYSLLLLKYQYIIEINCRIIHKLERLIFNKHSVQYHLVIQAKHSPSLAAILVVNNIKKFERAPGLRLGNWA
jgi:hypothetical protein